MLSIIKYQKGCRRLLGDRVRAQDFPEDNKSPLDSAPLWRLLDIDSWHLCNCPGQRAESSMLLTHRTTLKRTNTARDKAHDCLLAARHLTSQEDNHTDHGDTNESLLRKKRKQLHKLDKHSAHFCLSWSQMQLTYRAGRFFVCFFFLHFCA